MDLIETFRTSLTAILTNRLRSFLTILGIVIGVMTIIILISLVTGLKSYITGQIEGLGSNLMFVIPGKIGGGRSPGGVQANRLILQDATDLKKGLGTTAEVSAVIQRTGTLEFGRNSDKDVTVFGVEANYPKLISIKFSQGQFFNLSETDSGKRVAVIGQTVLKDIFNGADPIDKRIDLAGLKYTVIGVAAARGSTFGIDEDNSVFVPLNAAQKQFGIQNLNTIYISAANADNVKQVQAHAITILKKRLTEDDFSILTQEQTLSTISQITGVLTLALGGITAISLLVGGIGIMNIMLVSVTERTREIGLRKALGATPEAIRNQFLVEAISLSCLGGVIGIILGVLISFAVGHFITTTVPLYSIALSFGFSMLVGIVFGVAPAIRASRLNPIQALRYE